jgi:hypothetical protein
MTQATSAAPRRSGPTVARKLHSRARRSPPVDLLQRPEIDEQGPA